MSWNYRIIDHGDLLALHEVHYDEDGQPQLYTNDPATLACDYEEGPDGLARASNGHSKASGRRLF